MVVRIFFLFFLTVLVSLSGTAQIRPAVRVPRSAAAPAVEASPSRATLAQRRKEVRESRKELRVKRRVLRLAKARLKRDRMIKKVRRMERRAVRRDRRVRS